MSTVFECHYPTTLSQGSAGLETVHLRLPNTLLLQQVAGLDIVGKTFAVAAFITLSRGCFYL
jgi:hypothetical protein